MTDVERLLAVVESEPWESIRILADALEEAGDPDAAGWRMIAQHKKFPSQDDGGYWLWNNFGMSSRYAIGHYTRGSMAVTAYANFLPITVFKNPWVSIAPPRDSDDDFASLTFMTPMEAMRYAAKAWSMELARFAQRRKRK